MAGLADPLFGQTLLSLNQPVTASSYQAGNYPTNGNDGDLTTRWAASDATYPQWWQVDLGNVYRIDQAVTDWFTNSSTPRSYQYQILTSTDGVNFNLLVNNTNNAALGIITNNFSALARYIQIYVTGSSYSAGYASFYECQIFGGPAISPYTPDANTLCLFHLDEPAGGSVTTNMGRLGGNAYTVSESNESERIRRLVARGMGVAILPQSDADRSAGHLAVAALTEPSLRRDITLACREGRRLSPAAAEFLQLSQELFSSRAGDG